MSVTCAGFDTQAAESTECSGETVCNRTEPHLTTERPASYRGQGHPGESPVPSLWEVSFLATPAKGHPVVVITTSEGE
jgi:hypothetical protein